MILIIHKYCQHLQLHHVKYFSSNKVQTVVESALWFYEINILLQLKGIFTHWNFSKSKEGKTKCLLTLHFQCFTLPQSYPLKVERIMCKKNSKKGNMLRDNLTWWIFPFLEKFLHIILSTFYGQKIYGVNQGSHIKKVMSLNPHPHTRL